MAEAKEQTTPRDDKRAPRSRRQGRGGRRDDRRNQRDDAPKEFEEVVINIDRRRSSNQYRPRGACRQGRPPLPFQSASRRR